jgi:HEAT repeat protein
MSTSRCAATATVEALAAALVDADPGVRRHATQALAAFGALAQPAAGALAIALDDECPDVRRNAALALKQTAHHTDSCSSANSSSSSSGGGGSGGGGGESKGSSNTSSGHRGSVGGGKSTGLVERLVVALGDRGSYKVRRDAAQTLGQMGADAAAATKDLCEVGACDPHCEVRKRAAQALGLVGKGILQREDEPAQLAALAALVAALGTVVQEELDLDTRRVAALALLKLGAIATAATPQLKLAAAELTEAVATGAPTAAAATTLVARQKVLGLVAKVLAMLKSEIRSI